MTHHDLEFDAIVGELAAWAEQLPASWPSDIPEIRRIASAVFCGAGIDPSIVTFAVRRTALHWGRHEDEIDVAVTIAVLANAARVMDELRPLDVR